MSLETIARKNVILMTENEQIKVKGGTTDWIIITDTTLV